MSLTYSPNQSRHTGSRAVAIAFIVMLHAVVLIAFNNGIGKIFKFNPPNDVTVIDVPPEPQAQQPIPAPQVPKSIPDQMLTPPPVDHDIQIDIAPVPSVSDSQPSQTDAATTGSEVLTVDKLSLTSRVDPVYPSSAQRAGEEGTVLLEIIVDTNGRAMDVRVTRSSGFDVLDAAAVQAVKKWHFNRPSTIVKVHVPITFKLQRSN